MPIAQTPHAPTQDHDAELTLSSSKRPQRPAAAVQQQKKNETLAATAAAMRERAAEAAAAPPETPPEPPAPREDVESIEVKLLDGRTVLFGPPKGVSLTMRIAMNFPEATTNPMIDRLARVLMSVQSIDGKRPIQIGNMVDLTKLANEIGDIGIDELFTWLNRYWGDLRINDTQVLKKNLRG
jgi:hypothetical protein